MKITALLLAFYMLLGSFIPRSDFSQLAHIGDLRAHYLQHQAEANLQNQSITFLEFLYIHFIDLTQHAEGDHEEHHEELPFQSINLGISFLLTNMVLPVLVEIEPTLSPSILYQSPFYLVGFYPSTLQPPSFL